MPVLPEYVQNIYADQQNGINTDCSFEFDVVSENDECTKKVIHAHKIILSSVSDYFKTNFKSDWSNNQPIPVTNCEHDIFEKLITAIYLGIVPFKDFEEACKVYEAAHFYCMEGTVNLLREEISDNSTSNLIIISSIVNLSFKYSDDTLKQFSIKAFTINAQKIIKDPDFLKYSPEAINYLYQRDDVNADERDLLKCLEMYVKETSVDTEKVKPAINAIRYLSLDPFHIIFSPLLSDTEKLLLSKKVSLNVAHNKKKRVYKR